MSGLGQTFTFQTFNERRLLSTEAGQELMSQARHDQTFWVFGAISRKALPEMCFEALQDF
jgi:hypothetical protein